MFKHFFCTSSKKTHLLFVFGIFIHKFVRLPTSSSCCYFLYICDACFIFRFRCVQHMFLSAINFAFLFYPARFWLSSRLFLFYWIMDSKSMKSTFSLNSFLLQIFFRIVNMSICWKGIRNWVLCHVGL